MSTHKTASLAEEGGSAVQDGGISAEEVTYYVTVGFRLCNLLVFGGMLAAAASCVFGWFPNALTLKDLHQKYWTVLTPDIWAYYIWLGIFGLQAIAMLDILFLTGFRVQHGKKGRVLHAIDHYWILGFICIGCWIATQAFESDVGTWVSFGFAVGALASFLMSLLRLHGFKGWFNVWYYVVYMVSAGITSGWLCIEVTIATLLVMRQYNVSEDVQQFVGIGILAVATVAGLTMVFLLRELAFNVALIWGLLAILVTNVQYDADYDYSTVSHSGPVIATAVLAAVLAIASIVRMVIALVWDMPKALRRQQQYQDVASHADDAAESGFGGDTASVASSSRRSGAANKGAFNMEQQFASK